MTHDHKAVVRELFDAHDRGDFEAWLACYHPEAVIPGLPDDVPATPEGLLTVRRRLWFNAFADTVARIDTMVAEGDHVAVFWSWTGKHTGDFGGIPATGREVSHNGVSLMRFVDGKVIEESGVGNIHGLLKQIQQP